MPNRRVAVGICLSTFEPGPADRMYGRQPWHWADIRALVEGAEAAGVDAVWLPDHLLYPVASDQRAGAWETFSTLAALAASTERIRLGVMVASAGFRNPALLAKIAETIDEISGGRLILGIGVGGRNRLEFDAFGFPFDQRFARFEEALQVLAPLLRTGHATFAGEFFQVQDCEIRPRGPRPGQIPLLLGSLQHGSRMLALAAQYADIWSGWMTTGDSWPEAIAPVLPLVDAACMAAGRDPATLQKAATVSWVLPTADPALAIAGARPLGGTIAEVAQAIRDFGALGIDQVQIMANPTTVEDLSAFESLMRELAA